MVGDGSEPVADDEILYRRVPQSTGWYSPDRGLRPEAFGPRKDDVTGISLWRARYKSIEDAAVGRPGKSYYVAVLRVGDLRQEGIEVVPRPLENDPGHAELPQLNAQNRKSDETLERQRLLVELTLQIVGPFSSSVKAP